MTTRKLAIALDVRTPPAPEPDLSVVATINAIRLRALRCRSARRTDFTGACALLATDRQAARHAFIDTLVRCLSQATGKTPVLFRPGARELSGDEAWLARMFDRAACGDSDSLHFLIASRVPPWARRNLAFLVRSISERSDQV